MLDRSGKFITLSCRCAAAAGAALLMSVIATEAVWPQSAAPPSSAQAPASPAPSQSEPAPESPPSPENNPGLIEEMGKFWEKSLSILPTLKSPGETIDDLSRLAKPGSMVTGRMMCPVSANGAPDCKAASDKLCQTKGFKEGKSLNTDSAEKCTGKVYLPGYHREPGDCRTENYVTRALCQ